MNYGVKTEMLWSCESCATYIIFLVSFVRTNWDI